MYLSVNRVLGFAVLIVFLLSPPVMAMCGTSKSYLADVEILSCKAIEGEQDLLVEGKRIQYFELNKPISMFAGSGELDSWVFSNSSHISCDQLEGTSQRARIELPCCDSLPHFSLACKTGRAYIVPYINPAIGPEVSVQQLHQMGNLSYLIGEDIPYSGLVVEYYLINKKLKSRMVYENGRPKKFEFWYENGQLNSKFILIGNEYKQRTYYEDGTLKYEEYREDVTASLSIGYEAEWDREGKLILQTNYNNSVYEKHDFW